MNNITTKADLFNKDSICIFTDSSFKKNNSLDKSSAIGTTAPAYCIYQEDNLIEQGFHILHNSTSQQGELYAMFLGVVTSYKYKGFPHIRIFADNQNAVFSIREWIFNWVTATNNGKLVLGENGRINNQSFIMDIINAIMYNQIYLELYHIKGHVDIRKYKSMQESKSLFQRSNPFCGRVDDSLIMQLAMGNNTVDEYSTVMLRSHLNEEKYSNLVPAVTFGYTPFDMKEYISLVNKDGKRYYNKNDNFNNG